MVMIRRIDNDCIELINVFFENLPVIPKLLSFGKLLTHIIQRVNIHIT